MAIKGKLMSLFTSYPKNSCFPKVGHDLQLQDLEEPKSSIENRSNRDKPLATIYIYSSKLLYSMLLFLFLFPLFAITLILYHFFFFLWPTTITTLMDQEAGLPPGFRFHPSDEELITYYLTRKVFNIGFTAKAIAEVDLNKCEPWDLPGKASMGEKEWYFFSLKDRKYPTGMRTNRATNAGYWKTTGKDKEIFHCGVLVGMKKTLVFYKGRAPKGEKTNWVMHEYRLHSQFPYKPSKEEWVVCRVFKKISTNIPMRKFHPSSPSMSPAMLGSPAAAASLSELGEIDVSMLSSFPPGPSDNPTQVNDGNKVDLSLYMNWLYGRSEAAAGQPLPPWPSSLLSSKALQIMSNYQPLDVVNAGSSMNSNIVGEGNIVFPDHNHEQQQQQQQQQYDSIWRGY